MTVSEGIVVKVKFSMAIAPCYRCTYMQLCLTFTTGACQLTDQRRKAKRAPLHDVKPLIFVPSMTTLNRESPVIRDNLQQHGILS